MKWLLQKDHHSGNDVIGKKHRIYGCGSRFGCKCQERVFKDGDLIAFLYSTDGLGQPRDRGDLGILVNRKFEEDLLDEESGYKWKLIYWIVFHQKNGKYYDDVAETEFDFVDDLGVYHD